MLPIAIKTKDCGTRLDGVGNACFFLSVLAGIMSLIKEGLSIVLPSSFEEIRTIGGWSSSRKGTMVDTDIDNERIEQLARRLNIRIFMGVMIGKDTIDAEKVRIYGTSGPEIGVVQEKNCPHFVMFKADFEMIESIVLFDKQRTRKRELQAITKQVAEDSVLARKIALEEGLSV